MKVIGNCVEEGLCTCGRIHERKGRALRVTQEHLLKKASLRSIVLGEEETESFETPEEA